MKLRLFILDDDVIQNDIMMEYLNLLDLPLSSTFFDDGNDMLEHISNLEEDELPHVVFTDLFMPKISGWEVLSKLEEKIETTHWVPSIYVVSSSVSHKDKVEAERQKFLKDFCNKPIGISQLRSLLKDEFDSQFPP